MALEMHKSDYVMFAPNGQLWQVGSRTGSNRQVAPSRWLEYQNMNWKGAEWQVGYIDFRSSSDFSPGRLRY